MAHKHGVIDQAKLKSASKVKWAEKEYNVHEDADFAHKYVRILCNTNKFP